jgi:hypothetical protein
MAGAPLLVAALVWRAESTLPVVRLAAPVIEGLRLGLEADCPFRTQMHPFYAGLSTLVKRVSSPLVRSESGAVYAKQPTPAEVTKVRTYMEGVFRRKAESFCCVRELISATCTPSRKN